MTREEKFNNSFAQLKAYCEREAFKGWDPYDGLNSKLFQASPLKYSKLARLAWIQFFKRSSLNFRKFALVPKEYNSKGIGLFVTAYCNLYKVEQSEDYKLKIYQLINILENCISKNYSGACWGYNFDWQARAFLQPKYTPTVVATSFIAYSLLDAYELFKEDKWLKLARSACNFVLKDLNRSYDNDGDYAFSYSPLDKTEVFNASLLGAKLLSRVYSFTNEKELINEARKVVSFCCKHQKSDGAWAYSTLPYHQWIDNFHTGFNLEAISEYQRFSNDNSFFQQLELGLNYYLKNFFLDNGMPKYYHNKLFPIDIHSPAQLIVTLCRLNKLKEKINLVEKVIDWTIDNMQDSKNGYFYYQLKQKYSSKIPYMRWAQAWMMYAMSFYIFANKISNNNT